MSAPQNQTQNHHQQNSPIIVTPKSRDNIGFGRDDNRITPTKSTSPIIITENMIFDNFDIKIQITYSPPPTQTKIIGHHRNLSNEKKITNKYYERLKREESKRKRAISDSW